MKDVLLTSSVLIGALLILRLLFRRVIARRVQYALWLLVAVRLLVPVSLPAADFSVLTAAEPVSRQITAPSLYMEPVQEDVEGPADLPALDKTPSDYSQVAIGGATKDNTRVFTDEKNVTHTVEYARQIHLTDILAPAWYAGIAVMLFWMLVSNLRFWQMLRRKRVPYEVQDCLYPVYLVKEGLSSPCLFGLVSPAIYLTPAAVETPERLRHVIAHENAHARHLDHLWALVRSVCLAVYWFDPLVWAAAAASKADGELACDEAALKRLGDAERLPYGRTLLALIPVGGRAPTPLLSTTMTSGKRQLKDRILRIAQNRRTVTAALFAVIALAAGVCAVTFTGGKIMPQTEESRPLTGDELAYFNEEFFNDDTVGSTVGLNIHNQFLTSLYERPEDIDLFELFYCGTGLSETMTEMERQLTGSFDADGALICPTDKLSVDAINTVLLENTGLNLEETAQKGLEDFQYLPEYDAYYHSHGDTNYFYGVSIAAGERQGNTIRLYYPDSSARYQDYCDWLCVTLEAREDGNYWFVSNLPAEKPHIATVYPEGEPVLTISLNDLVPIEPEPVTVTHRVNDCAERGYGILLTTQGGEEYSFRPYRSTDGNVYAALIYEEAAGSGGMAQWDVGTFFTYPADAELDGLTIESFSLFGYTGVVVSYDDYITGSPGEGGYIGTHYDYYAVSDDGALTFLFRAYSTEIPQAVDLDGDGTDELAAATGITAQVFFQRDGAVYEADIAALVRSAWPEAEYLEFNWWDTSRRCLPLWSFVPLAGEPDVSGTAWRTLYFDGEALLLYKDTTTYTDHVADSIDVPDEVLAAAQARVLEELGWWQTHSGGQTYVDGEWQDVGTPAEWDDWRITSLKLVDEAPAYPELGIKVYSYSYELHTTTPARAVIAGGMYLDEDGWVGGINSDNCLVFHTMTSSGPTLLESDIPTDVGNTSDSPVFAACLAQTLLENDLLTPSQVRDADLYYMFYNNQSTFLNLMGTYDAQEQDRAMQALTAYAVSIADTSDGDLLDHGLQNLEWNSSALTEEGLGAYERLLAAVEQQQAVDAEATLAAFTANPAAFLARTLSLPESEQETTINTLAAFYNDGSSAQRARFSDALHSLTQPQLGASATALYERLRAACDLPGPAARSSADDNAIFAAVDDRLERWKSIPGVTAFTVLATTLNEEETARMVDMWVASLSANANGWSDAYTARMTAVQAVFEVQLDPTAMSADTASLSWEDGVNACWFYLLPSEDGEDWEIADTTGCAVPAQYRADPENLPWVSFAEPTVSFTHYESQAAARDAILNQPDSGLQLYEELAGQDCTVISWAYGGTPHGTAASLNVLYADGTVAHLPLPPKSGVGAVCDPAENLTLSADGTVLTYTASFDDTQVTSDGTALIHRAGTYHYTYDMAHRTVALEIAKS